MNYQVVSQAVKQMITPPMFPDKERTQSARWFKITLVALIVLAMGASMTIPATTWHPEVKKYLYSSSYLIILVNLLALRVMYKGHLRMAALITLSSLFGLATYLNLVVFKSLYSPDVLAYFALIPMTGLLVNREWMNRIAILCTLAISAIYYLEATGTLVPTLVPKASFNDFIMVLIIITMNTFFLNSAIQRVEENADEARQAAVALYRANQELEHHQTELRKIRDNLEVRVEKRTEELHQSNLQLQAKIEERQRLLDALHKSEVQWRSLVTNAPEIIATITPTGRISFINRTVNGQPPEALIGMNAATLYAQVKAQESFKQHLQQVVMTGETVTYESERAVEEKSIWHLNRLAPIQHDSHMEALILLATDITEQKQTEATMHRMQKMESLGVLAGGVAHDFNNLLTAMSGQQSLALLKLPANDPVRRYLQQTMKAIERATELTRQMLNYAGRGRSEQKMIKVNDLVIDNTHLFSASIPKNVRLSTMLTDDLPMIYGDQGQLQQLIMNLILNSADAIGKEAGEVKIITCFYTLDQNEAATWSWTGETPKPGSYILLKVQDTGCGMDATTLAKIFDPFFTTKFTGRGLGLASVLGIVRTHQGGLRVESTLGQGTTFLILLPITEQSPPVQKEEISVSPLSTIGELILLIDDEKNVCEATTEILTMAGLKVIAAYDGRTGLAEFHKQQALIKLIILDLSMPEMSGEAVLAELRKVDQSIPILLTSGYDEYEVMKRIQDHAVNFIPKPYTVDTLLQAVYQPLQKNK